MQVQDQWVDRVSRHPRIHLAVLGRLDRLRAAVHLLVRVECIVLHRI